MDELSHFIILLKKYSEKTKRENIQKKHRKHYPGKFCLQANENIKKTGLIKRPT